MLHPPGPGIKLMSPALGGRFFTTEPAGKPSIEFSTTEETLYPLAVTPYFSSLQPAVTTNLLYQFSLAQFSRSVVSDSVRPHEP